MLFLTEHGFNMYAVLLQQLYNWQIDWRFMRASLPWAYILPDHIQRAVCCPQEPLLPYYSLDNGYLSPKVVRDAQRLGHRRPRGIHTEMRLTPWLLRVHVAAARRLFEAARQALLPRLHDADLVDHVLGGFESQLIDAIARRCFPVPLKDRPPIFLPQPR
jgi:hypothetical protein